MFTREHLKQSLEEISASAAVTHDVARVACITCDLFIHNSGNKYSAEVITDLKNRHAVSYYDGYAGEWLKKFSTFTNMSWSLSKFVGRKQLPYSRTYRCHYKFCATKNTPQYSNIYQNLQKLVGGPEDCLSHVTFKFAFNDKNKGSKITIVINNSYCKRLHIQNYFLELASGDKSWTEKYLCGVGGPPQDHSDPLVIVDGVYYRYFADGHTLRSAKLLHLLTLLCEYGNNAKVLSDQTKNPLMSHVNVVYRNFKLYVKDDCINFKDVMSRKQAEMEQFEGLIRFQSQDMVTIITPTMRRVLFACELDEVIISSTAVSQGPMVTLFFIPSKVGALCFACVLHKPQEAYSKVFLTIKSLIEKDYTKTFKPQSVVISDISSKAQLIAAETVYQNSKVFIAPWSLCSSAWIWICNKQSVKSKSYRHEAMFHFHNIMNATDTESALVRKKKFMSIMIKHNWRFFRDYLCDIWKQYRQKIWWSATNNPLVALSITLLQQLFIQKCASFEIIHMCDVINTLDKHFQKILWSWVDTKQPILKIHSQFVDKNELKSITLELTSPREFSIEGGVSGKLRTDTWCCDCPTGRKGTYCEHLRTLMDLADVIVPLSCDEKHLFKQIAGENDNIVADENCEEMIKIHPTYTDGHYLFHIPININLQFTCKQKSVDLSLSGKESYNLIINDLIEKYILTNPVDDPTYVQGVEKNVSSEKPVAGREAEQELVAEHSEQKRKRRRKEENMDTEDANIQSKHLIEESGEKNNREGDIPVSTKQEKDEYNNEEKIIDSSLHCKAGLHHAIDLKIDILNTVDDDKNLQEATRSETPAVACSSVNNFEFEYKTALDDLRKEFKKFTDGLQLSSSDNKLDRIVQITKEFSITRMNLLNIQRQCKEHNVD